MMSKCPKCGSNEYLEMNDYTLKKCLFCGEVYDVKEEKKSEVCEGIKEKIETALKNNASKKPSNPKDACGIRKPPQSCIPQNVMMEVGVGMLEGALKYGRHNYRAIGVRSSVYYDACRRHLDYYWEGEDIDPDSDLHHVTKAICCLVVLRDAMLQDKITDDRPPKSDVKKQREEMQKIVERLMDKYPVPANAYTEVKPSLDPGEN